MMTNQNGSASGSSSEQVVHKRCTICNVPFINPDLISVHYRHHMTPKICVILGTDEDGNQKYVELTQQQALAYNAGALPILQNAIGAGGGQQYILTDQGGQFKATAFDGSSQQLIAAAYQPGTAGSLGAEAVEMVHYVDSSGHELGQDEVQYYALDGQEYSVIQANEEIVVSTEARLPHEEQQQLVIEEAPTQQQVVMSAHSGKAKGRATKRKNSSAVTAEPPKTYSRRGQQQTATVTASRGGVTAKKILLADDQSTFAVSAASKQQVQSLQQQHLVQQQQADGSVISFVTSTGQTHHVTTASNHHLDLHADQFLSPSSISGEEIVVSHVSPSKLKTEPIDLMTSQSRDHVTSLEGGSDAFHTSAELKPLGLKVEPHQQQLLQQQQQYIVLAYDNESGLHQLQQSSKSNNVTVVEGFDLKEEKVTV